MNTGELSESIHLVEMFLHTACDLCLPFHGNPIRTARHPASMNTRLNGSR